MNFLSDESKNSYLSAQNLIFKISYFQKEIKMQSINLKSKMN